MRGRKPIPTALKLVRGNPGGRPLNMDADAPPLDANVMPDWLSDGARKHWPIIAEHLRTAGLLTVLDATALGLYCEAFCRWRDANEKIVNLGAVVKSKHGYPIPSPYLQVANQAYVQMTRVLAEFGMTPSSRSRCTVAPQSGPNPYMNFVKKT